MTGDTYDDTPPESEPASARAQERHGGAGGAKTSPLVMGAWLVTVRKQIVTGYGPDALERVLQAVGDEHKDALDRPSASAWYSEDAFQAVLAAVAGTLLGGDAAKFAAFVEECTVAGVNRFMRIALAFASPEYLLRKMPFLWGRHRRHHGALEVEVGARRALLRYTGFPFFHDRNYRHMVVAILRKTLELVTGVRPDVTVRDFSSDWLYVEVFYGKAASVRAVQSA